jgi:aldehyde dehydrogenase (NAD+)
MITGLNFIGGRWCETARSEPNLNPSNLDDVVGVYHWSDVDDAVQALEAARAAQAAWANGNLQARSDLLHRIGGLIHARAGALAELLSREQGKLIGDALAEVTRSGYIFQYFAGEVLRNSGQFVRGLRDGFTISVEREPVGTVLLITPWNFPMVVPSWKIAAALAFGNCAILKPSEFTPAIAVALVEIIAEAGTPPGVVNLVMGDGQRFGEQLIAHVDAVSFTGSNAIGRVILNQAAKSMTKVQLELGGKNPLVVLDDADLDHAVDVALQGSILQMGQRCTASSRLIVTRRVHDAFAERLARRVAGLRIGAALDPNSELGPVATDRQLARNIEFVTETQAAGAELLHGGGVVDTATRGYYMQPALFVGTRRDMRINIEEVFGPVVGIMSVEDSDEAIEVANDTEYALSSGICTRSIKEAEKFRRASRAGLVTINAPTAGIDYHVPFGGKKPSGYGGRENGPAAQEFYTEIKTSYNACSP